MYYKGDPDNIECPGVLETVEDAAEVIVGRTYLVNTVWSNPATSPFHGEQIPVLGPFHEDIEIIKFPYEHYHVDWRFIDDASLECIKRSLREQRKPFWVENLPLHLLLGLPISYFAFKFDPHHPVRLPMECYRPMPLWEKIDGVPWLADLERAYISKRACHDVCPHRGISLKGAPEDERGARVCPGHGLCWDKETGALRPRALFAEGMKNAAARSL